VAPGPAGGTLALLGVGYMGGSLALAARAAGLAGTIVGYDPHAPSAALALQQGIVDRVATQPADAVQGAAVVVLAAPVRSLVPLAQGIADRVAPDALVIDIGSVKGPVIAGVEATSLASRFVGCHPLAGTEASGPGAADASLYAGKPCFICPGPASLPAAIERAKAFWQGLGASVLLLDPDAHDLFMAAGSHLPHVAAFALAACLEPDADMLEVRIPRSYPPTSLRDSTRVAASNPAVWRDILIENRAKLLPRIDRLQAELAALKASLEGEDPEALQALLERGRSTRRRIVK
jgi:prephenate dehydrogenase